MEKSQLDELIGNAIKEYEQVIAEYNKPSEDVVMYATCHIIQKAIVNFLDAFLLSHNEVPLYGKDILSLQQRCAELNKSFMDIDYSVTSTVKDLIGEPTGDQLYQHIKVLEQTKDLVLKILKVPV